jgi:hypothetical protein
MGVLLRGCFVQRDFASAAIAAAAAFFAQVILATVLGAGHADTGGFLFADRAVERHLGHFSDFFLGGVALVGRVTISRQRCAS